ncbi:MAG: S8 family serine peptidase [Ignavibacterium sp.]|jgi:subtilisin family serine protease|uniref:S8 family serine peptidase n=1 Tax=Ignavibacterium sp. TaxID=2651167 RepID=UPI00329699AC
MKFKFVLFLFLFTQLNSFSQSTFFIKYKNSVALSEIANKIAVKKISGAFESRPVVLPDFQMNYLANGLAKEDEILGRIITIRFSKKIEENYLSSLIMNDPEIEYIQEARTYQIDALPNDSLVSQQWALDKIKAFDAWEITQGADTVLLAVIDTGIEYFHPDLENKIYLNPGEIGMTQPGDPCWSGFPEDKRFNNCDDDGNGFIDDFRGWDFVDRAGFPTDTTGGDFVGWDNNPYDPIKGLNGNHGTFVAGIIGAQANNFSGIAGAAPKIKILNLRAFENGGGGEEDDVAAAILYAVKMKCKVINMSFGDYSFSYVLRDVIAYAYSQNTVLVASSGNRNINTPHYPSGYSEVISVGNSTIQDYVASNSTWGPTLDLVAPGTSILSTDMNGGYFEASGTSASAPFVSATAALILSIRSFNNEEVKQIIKSTTDDIGETGWDLRSGAGRLNMYKALRVLAPSSIKFHFPKMDYTTNNDTIPVVATILSASFVDYKLQIGEGYEPNSWTTLIEKGVYQVSNSEIYRISAADLDEGTYSIRLMINQNNDRTLEERIIIHIVRSPPKVVEIGVGSLYYGDRPTIAGEFYTDQLCIMKLYYRELGSLNFNFISLDGFNTNNQFVKQVHYGFIPKDLVTPNQYYEVYFEAENLAGLKTVVVDSLNNNNYFILKTENIPNLNSYSEMPFSLPVGNLYDKPVSFLSDNYDEIIFQILYESPDAYFGLYKLMNQDFVKIDSVLGKFPRAFGDFNNNGRKDFISYKLPDVIIDEQVSKNSFTLSEKYKGTALDNVVFVDDLDYDGIFEIISQKNFNSFEIREINQDLTVDTTAFTLYKSYFDTLDSDKLFSENNYVYNNLLVVDSDNDNIKEIWFVDADGDLISYKILGKNNIHKGDSLRTVGLRTNKNNIFSAGDYNGDGIKDFAILYNTNSIAPTFLLLIITFIDHQPQIILQKVFLDQSSEYIGGVSFSNVYQSIKFVDVDNDQLDELVLSIYPSVYIFDFTFESDQIIFYKEGANNFRIFSGDLNQNSVKEIGLTINDRIRFYEFSEQLSPSIPGLFTGFSIDSSLIKLQWSGLAERFYIYKGNHPDSLILIDSLIFEPSYIDNSIELNKTYYYGVRAYDPTKPIPLSGMSNIIEVYAHKPAFPVNAVSNSSRSVIVTFSEKMKNTIDNLQSFNVIGLGYPNSISANNQYSYFLTFNSELPGGLNKLIINGLRDYYNSPIEPDTLDFVVTILPQEEEFFVTGSTIINPYQVEIKFNLPVDENSALNKNNYIFSPPNNINNISVNDSSVTLDLLGGKPVGSIGKEYVLQIKNLKSSTLSGNIPIKSGAGSYIVLTGNAQDLSDVFVYPNPAKVGDGISRITFANLTSRVKINILTLTGKPIKEIIITTDNGGVEYDLTDEKGEKLPSGIYIYRIVSLDENRNEQQEIFGKFAVIR